MTMVPPRVTFLRSLSRCADDEDFYAGFLRAFLASSEEVQDKFRRTRFPQQHQMLLRSLRLSAGAIVNEMESLQELRARAETHDRHHLDIRPELYDYWLESVIATARQFDPEWSDHIESAWRTILGHVISTMVRRYSASLGVYLCRSCALC